MGYLSLRKVDTSSKVLSMRYAELTFLVLLVAYHAFLIVPRHRRWFPANYLVFLAGMALAWNLGLEGLRWQTLPPMVLLLIDLFTLFPTFATLRGRPGSGLVAALGAVGRSLVAFVALATALASLVLSVAFPLPHVELTGGLSPAYRVVRFPAQGPRPGLEVQVWYPASGDTRSQPRPGSGPETWQKAERDGGLPSFWQAYLQHLPTSLIRGGKTASPGTRYAVIYAAVPPGQSASDFGYLFEDLASRGFVVAAGGPIPPPLALKTDFHWEGATADLFRPFQFPDLWFQPELKLARGQAPDYQWLAATHDALEQLDREPGDPFFGSIDGGKHALWAWGTGDGPSAALKASLGLKGEVLVGGSAGAPATIPELRIVGAAPGAATANRWVLSLPALHRADVSDAAYLKPYLAFRGLKAQADAGLHGALRQYQAAFYQSLLWEKAGMATFGTSVPEVRGIVLTGR
jgi:hypothetical protein